MAVPESHGNFLSQTHTRTTADTVKLQCIWISMLEQVQKYGQLSNVILVTRTRLVCELAVLFPIETCRF